MNKQIETKREFKRIYINIKELCNRIYDNSHDYPRRTCAEWFVNDLRILLENDELRNELTNEQICEINEMGQNIISTEYLDANDKKLLSSLLKELRKLYNNTIDLQK